MLSNRFRFLTDVGSGFEQLDPVNDDFRLNWEPDAKWGYYTYSLEMDLNFCGDNAKPFIDLNNSCDRCDKIPVNLQSKCDGVWTDCITSYLNLNKGNFDEDNCDVIIQPTSEDEYSCFLQSWTEEKNICDIVNTVTINSLIGEIVEVCCNCAGPQCSTGNYLDPEDSCLTNPANGWTLISHVASADFNIKQSCWAREEYNGPGVPPGNWILEGSTYVRPVAVAVVSLYQDDDEVRNFWEVIGQQDFDNGMTFEDVINLWAVECDLEICSDFFNINPIGDAPQNTAYDCAAENLQNLVLYAKSDVINPSAFANATRCVKDLESLMCNYFAMFNIRFEIVDGKLRIEHVSYFESIKNQGLDLTVNYGHCLPNKYSYSASNFPQFEQFNWMDEVSDYFEGEDIEYKSGCTELGEKQDYDVDCITTDINYILANSFEDPDTGAVSNDVIDYDGFVLINAIEFNGSLYVDDNNNHLSFTELQKCYWLHDRFQYDVCICGEDICAESAKKTKLQEPIIITDFCCEDLKNFNPKDLVKTNLGWGEVVSASYSAKAQCLELTIIHDQLKCC